MEQERARKGVPPNGVVEPRTERGVAVERKKGHRRKLV
jgi:hypothetical protein